MYLSKFQMGAVGQEDGVIELMQKGQQIKLQNVICFNLQNVFVQISNGCSRSR